MSPPAATRITPLWAASCPRSRSATPASLGVARPVGRPHVEGVRAVGETGIGPRRRAGAPGARVEAALEARTRLARAEAETRRTARHRARRARVDRRVRSRRVRRRRHIHRPRPRRRRPVGVARPVGRAHVEGVRAVAKAGVVPGRAARRPRAAVNAAAESRSRLRRVEREARRTARRPSRTGPSRSSSAGVSYRGGRRRRHVDGPCLRGGDRRCYRPRLSPGRRTYASRWRARSTPSVSCTPPDAAVPAALEGRAGLGRAEREAGRAGADRPGGAGGRMSPEAPCQSAVGRPASAFCAAACADPSSTEARARRTSHRRRCRSGAASCATGGPRSHREGRPHRCRGGWGWCVSCAPRFDRLDRRDRCRRAAGRCASCAPRSGRLGPSRSVPAAVGPDGPTRRGSRAVVSARPAETEAPGPIGGATGQRDDRGRRHAIGGTGSLGRLVGASRRLSDLPVNLETSAVGSRGSRPDHAKVLARISSKGRGGGRHRRRSVLAQDQGSARTE